MARKRVVKKSVSGNGQSHGMTAGQLEHFTEVVGNVLAARSEFFARFFDPRRDIDDECGYPNSDGYISPEQYQLLYEREAVAARVVELFPHECWQVKPEVYEDENMEVTTPFEEDLLSLGMRLRPEFSYYQDTHGSALWEYLRRVDVLSGIGHYGVLLLGVNDGKTLDQPVDGMSDAGMGTMSPSLIAGSGGQYFSMNQETPAPPKRELLYIKAFPEYMCSIVEYEGSPSSMRYGMPKKYQINLFDPRNQSGIGTVPLSSVNVHWHRIVHIADNIESSETFGVPRMRPVLNRLLDLRKLYAGSAEMYWKGAFPGLSVESNPQLGPDPDIDVDATENQIEQYMNGLSRYLALIGMSAKSLAPQVVDPTPQIMVQIGAICIKKSVPVRIFMGSERGELASSQDDASWNDRVRGRHNNYLTPRVVVPTVDRLIALGVLRRPSNGYRVFWPDLTSQTDKEKASVAFQRAQALAQYLTSKAMEIMTPEDFLSRFMGFSEKEAISIVETARESQDAKDLSARLDGNIGLQSDDSTNSSGNKANEPISKVTP